MSNVYQVIDCQTNTIVGTYDNRKAASRRADKLDLAYGAVRYTVRVIWAAEVSA